MVFQFMQQKMSKYRSVSVSLRISVVQNFGKLLTRKNIYFTPMSQDDYINKPTSMVADFDKIEETLNLAKEGIQLQPILI